MLTMNVELWPFGDKSASKRLMTINVANLGASMYGDYDYAWTIDEPTPLVGLPIRAQGVLMGYNRDASCVDILAAILKDYELPHAVSFTKSDEDIFSRLRSKTLT